MALQKELQNSSVVILAQNFNPSIFNRYWLTKNEFIDNDNFNDDSVFAPGISNIITSEFSLLVTPSQLLFEVNGGNPTLFINYVNSLLIGIIRKLPEIPYKAIGLNFEWHVFDNEASSLASVSEELFYPANHVLQTSFNTDDSMYGCCLSKNFLNSRMKLDIQPATVCRANLEEKDVFKFSFNYHKMLDLETGYDNLLKNLKECNLYFDSSLEIVNAI